MWHLADFPTKLGCDICHFIVGNCIWSKTLAWLFQKMFGPFSIHCIGAPQAVSYQLSAANLVLVEGMATWNQTNFSIPPSWGKPKQGHRWLVCRVSKLCVCINPSTQVGHSTMLGENELCVSTNPSACAGCATRSRARNCLYFPTTQLKLDVMLYIDPRPSRQSRDAPV